MPVIGCGSIETCILLIIRAQPSDKKKARMFYLSKRGMCIKPIKAQNMPTSVHYLHRHEKGADESIILVEEV